MTLLMVTTANQAGERAAARASMLRVSAPDDGARLGVNLFPSIDGPGPEVEAVRETPDGFAVSIVKVAVPAWQQELAAMAEQAVARLSAAARVEFDAWHEDVLQRLLYGQAFVGQWKPDDPLRVFPLADNRRAGL